MMCLEDHADTDADGQQRPHTEPCAPAHSVLGTPAIFKLFEEPRRRLVGVTVRVTAGGVVGGGGICGVGHAAP